MSQPDEQSTEEDHSACSKWWHTFEALECAAIATAVAGAAYAFFWGGGWLIFWIAAVVAAVAELSWRVPVWALRLVGWRLRRQIRRRDEEIRCLTEELRDVRRDTALLRMERHRTEMLSSQLRAEGVQQQACISAIRAEILELQRLEKQRELEKEARAARRRLDIACAAIEADRLEAAAWRMEMTVKQIEVKLNQADLFESLSSIDNNAQDRIIAAYEQGIDHGKRGIVVPLKHLRHLRVVEESAVEESA